MGIKLNAILLGLENSSVLINSTTKEFHNEFSKVSGYDLSPKWLNIGFHNDNIVILNEDLVKFVFNDKSELHPIENSLVQAYPNSGISHVHQYDTIGFIGYCFITEKQKQRTKAVADGKLYLDQGTPLLPEIKYVNETIAVLRKQKPDYLTKFLDNISNFSKIEQYKKVLLLREEIFENEEKGYLNGGIDEEVLHTLIDYHLDSTWHKLTEINYIEYKGVSTKNDKLDILTYFQHAYSILKK